MCDITWLGQRDAYNKLNEQQYPTYSSCFITYYIMLTYYSLSIRETTGKQQVSRVWLSGQTALMHKFFGRYEYLAVD
jgi:hypothetical protein